MEVRRKGSQNWEVAEKERGPTGTWVAGWTDQLEVVVEAVVVVGPQLAAAVAAQSSFLLSFLVVLYLDLSHRNLRAAAAGN